MLKNIVVLCLTIVNARAATYDKPWPGKWFPHGPFDDDMNPIIPVSDQLDLHDSQHGISMGIKDDKCDNAEHNLEIDWYMQAENYTCFEDRTLYLPKGNVHPIHSVEHIPKGYSAPHKCLNESLEYNEVIPTFGPHRPLWAVYGEYNFLPKQRWVHNLEHGAVVMLYHPCANKNQINLLREIVKSCLYRHVITPYNLMSAERPLALVTWGHRLEMSKVATEVAIDFIKKYALQGPEQTANDGQYTLMLKKHSSLVTSLRDDIICPNFKINIQKE